MAFFNPAEGLPSPRRSSTPPEPSASRFQEAPSPRNEVSSFGFNFSINNGTSS